MIYNWSEELETGNELIDSQHKQLIEALNNLLEASSSGKGQEYLNEMMKFLSDYTIKHFADEESLQREYGYPDYENHKKLHDNFKLEVSAVVLRLQQEGASISLVTQVSLNIGNWLRNHIKREDKKIAEYIRQQKNS